MLVCRVCVTLFIVALSLVALVTVVTSAAQLETGASSGSEDLALHATKSYQPNLNQSRVNIVENSAKVRRGINPIATLGFGNYSEMVNDASQQESLVGTKGSASRTRGRKKNQRKTADAKDDSKDTGRSAFWSEDVQVGCKELRARRYISDGFCTSEEPIKEVACAGNCLPIMQLPWYAEFVKTVSRTKLNDWQCVEDAVRKKKVKLLCQDGTSMFYRIKVVESCKCKKITNNHNRTSHKTKKKRKKKQNSKPNNGS